MAYARTEGRVTRPQAQPRCEAQLRAVRRTRAGARSASPAYMREIYSILTGNSLLLTFDPEGFLRAIGLEGDRREPAA